MNLVDADDELDAIEEQEKKQFLRSWKTAVKKIGPELFTVKSASVDEATDRDQLHPDLQAIEKHVTTRHDDHHYFLFAVVSFFSFLKIEEIFMRAGIGRPRIIDLQFLDETERMIIYSLIEHSDVDWCNH